jgi:hypothetical protein
MPDYRPDAPCVDLFTADEELVLTTWFELDRPSYGPWIDAIFDEWNIPTEIPDYRRIDAAVAQILLSGSSMIFQTGLLSRVTVLSSLETFLIVVLTEKSSYGLTTC